MKQWSHLRLSPHDQELTPEIEHAILAYTRNGAYPHVAAAAAGVTEETWNNWLARGRRPRAQQPYKWLPAKVEQAQAIARVHAEMAAFKEDPKFWLKNGPGRETENQQGWAAMVRPILNAGPTTVNLFGSPDFLAFLATLRAVLAPYPEALAALAKALEGRPQLPIVQSVPATGDKGMAHQEEHSCSPNATTP